MTGVVVLFQRAEEARGIRSLLVRNGFDVMAVCTQGSQALSAIDEMTNGIIVCGYKYPDMIFREVLEYLPVGFDMLLVASGAVLAEEDLEGIHSLEMPIKVHDFIDSVSQLVEIAERRKRKARQIPRQRSEEEKAERGKPANMGGFRKKRRCRGMLKSGIIAVDGRGEI